MNPIINFGACAIRADRIEAIVKIDRGVAVYAIGNNGAEDDYFIPEQDFESVLIKWHAALSTTATKETHESD